MDSKNKIIKSAKICYILSKILYTISCVLTLTFITLAIVLSCYKPLKGYNSSETACIFSTLAVYSFICIGLFWNVIKIFKVINFFKTPFNDTISRSLKVIAFFVIVLSIIPALIGSIVLKVICPTSELIFPISFGGVVCGIVTFLLGLVFKYGNELQKRDDETLWLY